MSENDTENPPLDSEDWEVAFRAYTEYPILAFILAQHFNYLKELVERGRKAEAVEGLDRAIESLMPHTSFRDAGRTVYQLAVTGNLKPDYEHTIREQQPK